MNRLLEDAITRMIKIANDDSHGYSQSNRWGPDYDCSSLIIQCLEDSGILVKSKGGALNTFTMKKAFEKCGFKAIKYTKMIALQRGDILLNENHHTVMYLGDGRIVHASSSETGGKTGKPGDQTGGEICIRSMYDYKYGWDYILRYAEDIEEVSGNPYKEPTSTLSMGSKGVGVSWLQWELVQKGYDLQIDGDFGKLTKAALIDFQKKAFPNQPNEWDGILGPKSRAALKGDIVSVPEKPKNPYTRPTRLIKLNCKGEDVKYCQWLLNQKDNANLVIDGSFGKLSKQATINFQKKAFPNQSNEHDGVIGSKTLKALES